MDFSYIFDITFGNILYLKITLLNNLLIEKEREREKRRSKNVTIYHFNLNLWENILQKLHYLINDENSEDNPYSTGIISKIKMLENLLRKILYLFKSCSNFL